MKRGDGEKSGGARRPRILIGLSEVAGFYRGLRIGFQRLGLPCTFINLSEHRFGFATDDKIWPVGWIQKADTRRRRTKNLLPRLLITFGQGILQAVLFFRLLPKHDIFIYCANRNFMAFLDLAILKLFRKKVVYVMHGCDSRAPFFDGAYNDGDLLPDEAIYKLTKFKKLLLKITERWSDFIVNIPPQAHLCEKKYINGLYIGLSHYPDSDGVEDKSSENEPGALRIIHCPSRPVAKGAPVIRKAIERLREKGINVDYRELIDTPNRVILEEIKRCDLAIDQVYSDYAMPGFATECAWLGKPVLLSGYAVDHWKGWMRESDLPPTRFCLPGQLEDELYALAVDGEARREVGRKMYAYVSERWQPDQVASNFLTALDKPPDHWWLDPAENTYLNGCCIEEGQLKRRLRGYLAKYGRDGLRLADKPDLESQIAEFCKGEN